MASERLDPQAKQKVNNTEVFPLLGAFDLSGAALSINVNDHG